jgi:hypothetical protein
MSGRRADVLNFPDVRDAIFGEFSDNRARSLTRRETPEAIAVLHDCHQCILSEIFTSQSIISGIHPRAAARPRTDRPEIV